MTTLGRWNETALRDEVGVELLDVGAVALEEMGAELVEARRHLRRGLEERESAADRPHVKAEPLNVGGIIHAGTGVSRRDNHRVATAPAPTREPRVQGLHSLEAEGLLKNARDM